ncbi:MAG TPA: response regulator transcription factor, partial [Gemmatimonadales bacterium]
MLRAAGLHLVATAGEGREAVVEISATKPRIVLTDSALGSRDTLRFIEEIRTAHPPVRIVVMGLLPAADGFLDFIRAGASGFIMQDATIEEFVTTIVSVADGRSVLPSTLTGMLFSHVASMAAAKGQRGMRRAARMTAREREVTALIAEGLSNKEIAGRLKVATYTVKSHVHNILEKLALHTRLELAAYAHHAFDQPKAPPK